MEEPRTEAIAWRHNVLAPKLRRRTYLALIVALSLFLLALQADALPVDIDLPGVPDLEIAYPVAVLVVTSWVLALAFLYASWLLYANTPVSLGFHKGGIVVGYGQRRPRLATALWGATAPRNVPWSEVRSIGEPRSYRLSRHDLLLVRSQGRSPWVLVGLSPELLRTVRETFRAHRELLRAGSWRGFVPVALPSAQGEQPATA